MSGPTYIVATNGGEPDKQIEEYLSRSKPATFVYLDVYQFPDEPADDVKKYGVYLNSNPVFRGDDHQQKWSSVHFNRIVWNRGGGILTIK